MRGDVGKALKLFIGTYNLIFGFFAVRDVADDRAIDMAVLDAYLADGDIDREGFSVFAPPLSFTLYFAYVFLSVWPCFCNFSVLFKMQGWHQRSDILPD